MPVFCDVSRLQLNRRTPATVTATSGFISVKNSSNHWKSRVVLVNPQSTDLLLKRDCLQFSIRQFLQKSIQNLTHKYNNVNIDGALRKITVNSLSEIS